MISSAQFAVEDGPAGALLHPQDSARSGWNGGTMLRGSAVSGALARAAERALDDPAELRPARWTLDLFRPAGFRASAVSSTVVRRGRRLALVDVEMTQDGVPVARATAQFLGGGAPVHGRTWSRPATVCVPPPEIRPENTERRVYYSEGVGWTGSPQPHQNADRKRTWHFPVPVVLGEQPTPFQQAAMAADFVNMVANWGDNGIEFINTDVTLSLVRLPEASGVGLVAEQREEHDGISVGMAAVVDRQGVVGFASVTGLANGQVVDPRRQWEPLEPGALPR
jgi:acyl-coenzyme A thioesterase PaaI-like protein